MAVLAGAMLSGGVDNMLCAVRIVFMCDPWFFLRACWSESVVAGSLLCAEVLELNESSVDEERL